MGNNFRINNVLFSVGIDSRTNTESVHSIHPYDFTEYHWARRSPLNGYWFIYRSGKAVATYKKERTAENIAELLYQYDRDLKPRIDRT